jgi:hypothetical protein
MLSVASGGIYDKLVLAVKILTGLLKLTKNLVEDVGRG